MSILNVVILAERADAAATGVWLFFPSSATARWKAFLAAAKFFTDE
jgi:hypothetical protein